MEPVILYAIIGVLSLIVGIVAGKVIFAKNTKKQVEEAEAQAQSIIKEAGLRAETIRKEKELEAKEKMVQLKADHDREVNERNRVRSAKARTVHVKKNNPSIRKTPILINRSRKTKRLKKISTARSRW